MVRVSYAGDPPVNAVRGPATGTAYPFHRTRSLFVDAADAVYMLGIDYEVEG
jgi:hypothetical protein